MLRTLVDIGDVEGKRVLVRSALNVSMDGTTVSGSYRLEKALPTIKFLLEKKARVILISHRSDESGSLKGVYEYLKDALPLSYVDDVIGESAKQAVEDLTPGTALILENVRRHKEEKENDDSFAQKLASFGDMYVNDDFPVSHREHASIVGIPKFLPSYAGEQFLIEYQNLEKALAPEAPSVAIIGGAKFVTKEPLILKLLAMYDAVFIGGALANDFFKAQGYEVGVSLVSDAPHIESIIKNPKLIVPHDVVVEGPSGRAVKNVSEVAKDENILDIGPASIEKVAPRLQEAKSILWNGPLGNFESGFKDATESLAQVIAETGAVSIVGGGDTVTAINDLGINEKFTFVSTAGGAMLDFLAHGTLPGIEALK